LLIGGFFALMLVMGVLGHRAAPDAALRDTRPSTFVTGPAGVAALADVLGRLGVEVAPRRIPLFGVADDLAPQEAGVALTVIEPTFPMTREEALEVVRYLRQGGTVVLAGRTGIERELGVSRVAVRRLDRESDTAAVRPPDGIGAVPPVSTVLGRRRPAAGEAVPLRPMRTDTLLAAENRRPVALRLGFAGGGRALIIGDADWLHNRSLRDTDVGALVVPWILSLGATRLVVDEYHHGFGRSGALVAAVWRWLVRAPPGWALLQLALAGIVTLAVLSVRFGPAVHVIPRRRRSPIEHLDALASGLDRVGGGPVVTDLLGRGLARRLRRAGHAPPPAVWSRDRERWLAALARGNDHPATRAAVRRLGWLLRERGEGDERILRTAQAVEDVWEALKRPTAPGPSSTP
jgi:hypothetical protein